MAQRTCTCPECGTGFTTSHPRKKWCSRACTTAGNSKSQLAKNAKRYEPRPCPECETVFTPTRSDSVYCSTKCIQRARYVPAFTGRTLICKSCGCGFVPMRKDAVFCSSRCNMRFRKGIPHVRQCGDCSLDISNSPPRTKYCETCAAARLAGYRQRYSESKRIPPREVSCEACGFLFESKLSFARFCSGACNEWNRKHPGVPRERLRNCLTCRGEFKPNTMTQVYCGRRCVHFAGKHLRRARLNAVLHEPINADDIFARDRWMCGLCHKKINKRLLHPHPMSASLDHIEPLSHGGDHVRTNVHAAHLRCNLSKNNRGGGEQLLLIG